MILEFDLGNTRCKWRVRDNNKIIVRGYQLINISFQELDLSLNQYKALISDVWVVSVVGERLESALINWSQGFLQLSPKFARTSAVCAGVVNGYAEPLRLGADRWLGVVCCYNRLRTAFVLVSFGTAITVDLVLQNGRHVGGFIAPGINLMLDSVVQKTYGVAAEKDLGSFDLCPGTSTTEAVYSALTAMLVGLIENARTQLHELDPRGYAEIIFTGGDSDKLLPFYPGVQQIPDLVLDGLDYVFGDSKNLEQ